MSRRRLAALLTTVAFGAGFAVPAAAQPVAPATRLAGTFQMSGTVTVAVNVRGEHAGETVQRTWTFTPACPAGPCATVQLVRARAAGTDTLTLTAVAPNVYSGKGRFYVPLRCAGRIYRPGEAVPFRIRVRVTATSPAAGGGTMATAITATYVNRRRLNLTPCLALHGHDAARYTGTLRTGGT
jgi:hypothetical protein